MVLSNAATFEVRNTPIQIVDLDRTSVSRGLVNRLGASGHFVVVGAESSLESANDRLLDGDITMAVVIPHDFERQLTRTGVAPVELSLNAEKGSAAGIVQTYAARVFASYAAEIAPRLRPSLVTATMGEASRAATPRRGVPRIEVRTRSWFNPTLNYKHYMVPGILVALMTMVGTMLASQNIARERELGTLEQLNVTPITKGQFIIGKLLPFWVLGLIELAIGLVVGRLVFGIPIAGSVPLLFAVAVVYLVVALGIGLWISALVETQQQAMFVTFFVITVYFMMSGLFTPADSMSPWAQVVSLTNPMRHFVGISRGILVKGAGPADIARPVGVLLASALIVVGIAVRQYQKRTA